MAAWSLAALFISLARDVDNALVWYGIMTVIVLGEFALFYLLVRELVKIKGQWVVRFTCLVIWLVSTILVATNLDQLYTDLHWVDKANFFLPEFGPLTPVVAIPNYLFLTFTVITLFRAYRKNKNPIERTRLQYVFLGIVAVILGSLANLVPFLTGIPVDIIANLINATLLSYAIFRHELLEIKLVARRGLLYSITTVIAGTSYFLILSLAIVFYHQMTGTEIFLVSLVVAIVAAIVVQPLHSRAQLWIDRLFFREKYNTSQMLQNLSQTAATELDLEFLTTMILEKITSTMHIDRAAFLLKEEKSGEYRLKAQKGYLPKIEISMSSDHPIIGRLVNNPNYLTKQELDTLPQFKGLWEWEKIELERLDAEIFFPLRAKNELVGILLVGPKFSNEQYTTDDRLTLGTLANQIAVSVANARLYAETDQLRAFNENIVQSMEEGILLEDESGLVTFVNPKVAELVGKPSISLIGQPAPITIPKDQAAKIEDMPDRLARGIPSRYEAELETSSGMPIPVLVSAQPLRTADRYTGRLYVLTDITERKQEEEERKRLLERIREQVQLIQQIIDTVPEGVFLLGKQSNIVLANRAANEYLEILANAKPGDVLTHLGNRPLNDLLKPPPGETFWHEVQAITQQENIDLDPVPSQIFEVIARAMEPASESRGWVLVLSDVTEERKVQDRIQQQDRLAALGQLAAGIAHDFNNMMVSIILYSDIMLRNTDLADKDRDRLKTIRKQGQRAVDLTQQILDFSRKSIMNRVDMDLLQFMNEQQNLLARMLPENIRINLFSHVPTLMINADPTRLQQVVMNLAINARDAMPEGGDLILELDYLNIIPNAPIPDNTSPEYKLLGPGNWAKIAVSDSGVGIPPDVLPHIFEPFFTTKEVGKGTGLGLPQVFGIIKQHGGHVQVDSQLGKGTTINVYLVASPMTIPKSEPSAVNSVAYGTNELVLLVEDDPLTRRTLKDSLEMLNYRVIETKNGKEALLAFDQKQDEIALVISDLVMPDMGGAALARKLKNLIHVPIIILTGHPLTEDKKWLESDLGVNWLQKPIDLEVLADIVSRSIKSV